MADDIQRTIYKLEIDDAGYIRGVDSLTNSTQRFTQAQEDANRTLQTNQAALKNVSDLVKKTKSDLDTYTGTNIKYRVQLETDFNNAQAEQKKLTDLVKQNQLAYENATKAAQNFANTSAEAGNIGAKIPAPTVVPSPVIQAIPEVAQVFQNIDLNEFSKELGGVTDEFDQLRAAIALAEQEMVKLDQSSPEFQQLSAIVDQGKKVLQDYGNAAQTATGHQISLRQEILNGNNELARLEQIGEGASKQYADLEKHVAHLNELYREQRQRVQILSSETRALDFGKAAIESAVSGFQLYTSLSVLAGGATEKLQKETLQLFAAMQLLTSLEQLANQVKRGGVIATNLQSAAQAAYTAVIGTSTGALKAFRLALLGTGIGAAAVAIGFLVKRYIDLKNANEEASERQKIFNQINEQAVKQFEQEEVHLQLVKSALTDLTIAQSKRVDLAKEYNKTADEANKLDLTQINNIDLVNAAIDRQIAKLKERAFARAAESVVADKAEKVFLETERAREEAQQFLIESGIKLQSEEDRARRGPTIGLQTRTEAITQFLSEDIGLTKAKKNLDEALSVAKGFITVEGLINKPTEAPKPKKEPRTIENIFEQERLKLEQQLAQLRETELTTVQSINDKFAAKLAAEQQRIAKLVAEKKVTPQQGQVLIDLAVKVNTEGLQKALTDFNKKITDARQKLEDELHTLQDKANRDQLNLIQDDFDRRKALIDFNQQKELADQKNATDERLKALDTERLLIGEEEYQKARQVIITTGEQEVNAIIARFAQERQDLSADIFKKSLDAYDNAIAGINSLQDKRISEDVKAESDRFLRGEINYETYQENLDKINKAHTAIRTTDTITELENELAAINTRLATLTVRPTSTQPQGNTDKEFEDLVARQQKVSNQLANLRKQDSEADAKDRNELLQKRLKTVNDYASAIGELTSSVIQFWQAANDAEQKALDRSITIQQRRVDEAQKIAERGNAQYLKSETDRLKELQVARENAARRQLAIDAALQASQLLVGITGAIAKIASGIGAAETIAEIAIIVGALATGYGLVKSLQGNQPKFKTGTTHVSRGTHPPGDDTIPAWLTEGEAVLPKQTNRKYKKSVEAIYHGKVPADVMNEFVQNYVNNVVNKKENKKEEQISSYQSFVENVSKVPTKVINEFINNYTEKRKPFLKGTTEVSAHPVWVKQAETAPRSKSKSYNVTVDAILSNKIPADVIHKFITNYVKEKTSKDHSLIDRSVSDSKVNNLETYTQFIRSIRHVPERVIEKFIKDRYAEKVNNYSNEVLKNVFEDHKQEQIVIDKIADFRQSKEFVKSENRKTISLEKLNKFVEVHHKIIPIAQPNYEKIKDTAELKISHDSKMAAMIAEQNKLLLENNFLQKEILKKQIKVEQRIDREGVSSMVTEFQDQQRKNKRV